MSSLASWSLLRARVYIHGFLVLQPCDCQYTFLRFFYLQHIQPFLLWTLCVLVIPRTAPFAQQTPCVISILTFPRKVTPFVAFPALDHGSSFCIVLNSTPQRVIVGLVVTPPVVSVPSKIGVRVCCRLQRCRWRCDLVGLGVEHLCAPCFQVVRVFLNGMYHYLANVTEGFSRATPLSVPFYLTVGAP